MKDNGLITILQDLVLKSTTNYTFMKVILKMEPNMEKERLLGMMMMLSMKESSETIK